MLTDEQGASKAHRLIWGALAIGAAYVAYSVMTLIITTLEPTTLQTPVVRPVSAVTSQAARPKNAYDFSFDPFHSLQIEPVVESNIGEDAPETSLKIKLAGRTFGPSGGAILQTPDGKQARYAIGEEIVKGVILKAVYRDYIALEQNGRIERLTIERSGNQSLLAPVEDVVDTPAPSRLPSGAKTTSNGASGGLLTDVNKLMSQVRLEPAMSQGRISGFKVVPNNGSVKLSDYGLKSGDIITTVGAYDVTQGRPDMTKILSAFQGKSEVNLTVLRSGSSINVKVKL